MPAPLQDMKIPKFRPWRELAVLALMVMDLSWVVPWYRSLTPATYQIAPLRAFLVFGSFLLGAHLATRLMNFLQLRLNLRRGIFLALLVIFVFTGLKLLLYGDETTTLSDLLNRPVRAFGDLTSLIPDEFVVSLIVLLVAWRGVSLAQELIGPIAVLRRFQAGVILIMTFFFINTLGTGETPGVFTLTFLAAALIAMGASRISIIGLLRGGTINPFDRRWFAGMLFAVFLVMSLAAGFSWLSSSQVSLLEFFSGLVIGTFAVVTLAVISPAIYLIPQVAERVPGLATGSEQVSGVLERIGSAMGDLAKFLDGLLKISGIERLTVFLKPILLWTILFGVGLLALALISNWVFREGKDRNDERETLIGSGELLQLLLLALQNRFKKVGESLAGLTNSRERKRKLAAARIRRIYAELMDLTEELGVPRMTAQTPLEFLPGLARLFPSLTQEAQTITQAYLKIRYGELPESTQEVDVVEMAWSSLKSAGKALQAEKKK